MIEPEDLVFSIDNSFDFIKSGESGAGLVDRFIKKMEEKARLAITNGKKVHIQNNENTRTLTTEDEVNEYFKHLEVIYNAIKSS